MNKEELKKQFLLKRLEDPNVEEWEKKDIRNKLGIFQELTEEAFEKHRNENNIRFFYDYIDQHINRLNRKNRTNNSLQELPDNLKSIYHLYPFSAILESDCFRDYSEKSLNHYEEENGDTSLREERDGLLKGLMDLELGTDKTLLEECWEKDEITDVEIEQMQERFWSADYKKDFLERYLNFIGNNKKELLGLQNI